MRVLADRKAARDERRRASAACDARCSRPPADGGNMIRPMLDAVRAEATLGEICGVLRDEWGVYREPARF